MNILQARFAKVLMAMMGHDPQVSDKDAVAFLQYNKFDIGAPVGDHPVPLITDKEVKEIYRALGGSPDVITVGDTVAVKAGIGTVKEIKYVINGLGTKNHAAKDVTKL